MSPFEIAGLVCLAYMAVSLVVALGKPPFLWKNTKIQGFVKLLGEPGATALVGGWGLLVGAVGVYLLVGMAS